MRAFRTVLLPVGVLLAAFVPVTAAPAAARTTATSTADTIATTGDADHPTTLARFYDQPLTWKRCGEGFPPAMRCTFVTVPLDYTHPNGQTISIAVSRLRAARPALRHGVLLLNPGGPGSSGLLLPSVFDDMFPPQIRDSFDLIGFDPRAVGRSAPITCELTEAETNYRFPPTQSFAADVRQQTNVARKCANANGPRLRHITTRNTARDMDVIRSALGEKTLSYLGYSYGSYLGSVYTQMFGRHADRIVLDSNVNPAWVWKGLTSAQAREVERGLDRWAAWTAARNSQFRLGTTGPAVRNRFNRLLADARHDPVAVDDWHIDSQTLQALTFLLMYDDRAYDLLSDLTRVAVNGDRLLPDVHDFFEFLLSQPFAGDSQTAAQLAILCGDAAWPRDLSEYHRAKIRDSHRYPFYGASAATVKPCTFWPYRPIEPPTKIGPGNRAPSILMIQAEIDVPTPHAGALQLHRLLRNSRMITLRNAQVHGVYGYYANPCVDDAATRYLITGQLPAKDLTCVNTPPTNTSLTPRSMHQLPGIQTWRGGQPPVS